MMGADFLLKALGLPETEIEALKQLLEPGNLKRVGADFLARFEAMEKRNIEMHKALMFLAQPVTGTGDTLAPFEAEMNRQSELFFERETNGRGSNDSGEGRRGGDYINGSHFGE